MTLQQAPGWGVTFLFSFHVTGIFRSISCSLTEEVIWVLQWDVKLL